MKKTYRDNHQSKGLQFLGLALFIVLIGSSTAAYGQDFFTNFQTAPNLGDFTLFSSPNSVTFTGGFTQTQGILSLYHSGTKSFMVTQGNTATITFETPAASMTLWLIDQSNTSVLTVFDQNSQVIGTFNATTSFVQVNVSPGCGQSVGSMTLRNNGSGMAVIDDFAFTAGQASSGETTLIANFMNGNNTVNNSRVYLWNPSANAGVVCVRAFTLPRKGGAAQELTATALSLGSLEAGSALNVKLDEDILIPAGITVPYTTDDGDLTLEFTVQAANVKGAAQVFSSSFASGTNPLQEVPSTPGLSPTVLVANFMNGNDEALNSRVYLWNPSTSAGTVTVRIFTLPLSTGMAQELTGAPLDLGLLGAKSAMNINVADDLLTPAGITTPYTDNGGNLTLEFTIQAADVRGAAQVFSSTFGFGVYPLQQIPSTPGASPTVLLANFMNGNSDAFKARVYLWNPSASAGDVTVRVFTLPIAGGLAEELTTTPLDLGSLEAESALNIKLAEDILDQLPGITTPYKTDGGNLTLEFTIQAADVVGAAQVFSSIFAFGTNPLQEVPSTPGASPTVLVANFMNGNSDALNSRVYLFNPSASAGDVTVRVFTLPIAGGLAEELTTTPLDLGSLEAESALNIKLAEDILTPAGLTPPYTNDGGNLTLEFTIQAADVVGAAQVFSLSFALGDRR